MKNLKRSLLLLFIACVLFCFVTKTNASPARYFDIAKRAGDNTVDNQHHTAAVETPTQQVSAPVSTPNWTSKVQHREPGVIRLYSREWWSKFFFLIKWATKPFTDTPLFKVAVYGSVNGIQKHMIVLGTFLILIGLFLCTMGFRQWQPALAVMGLLTFGLFGWIALVNCRPDRGYPNDTIVMIVVPICIGLVGAGIYFVFWGAAFYLAGGT